MTYSHILGAAKGRARGSCTLSARCQNATAFAQCIKQFGLGYFGHILAVLAHIGLTTIKNVLSIGLFLCFFVDQSGFLFTHIYSVDFLYTY